MLRGKGKAAVLAGLLGSLLVAGILLTGGCTFSDDDFRIVGTWRREEGHVWEEWTIANGGRFSLATSVGIAYDNATWTFDSGSNILTVCNVHCQSITVHIIDDNTLSTDEHIYRRQ
jgi:hypothetical protein